MAARKLNKIVRFSVYSASVNLSKTKQKFRNHKSISCKMQKFHVKMQNFLVEMSGVVLGGVVEVVGLNIARGKIFTESIGSFDSLYLSIFIYCVNLHQSLILCSAKAMTFVKLYFRTC